MSNVSNAHSITGFVAGKSAALTGQRLCKVGYKSTKNASAQFPSVCVSIPPVTQNDWLDDGILQRLTPHLNEYLEGVQDKIVRSLYESAGGKLSLVLNEEISVDQCIKYLEAESTGGRMTKEMVEKWFGANLRENLQIAVAEKMGTEDPEAPEVIQMVNGYKGMYASLSGGATMYPVAKVKQLLRALEFSADNEGEIEGKIRNRLEGMLKAAGGKQIELTDL